MLKCDNNCYNLCKVPVCWCETVTIATPFVADDAGEYTIHYEYLNSASEVSAEFEVGEEIKFDLKLNENQCYCMQVKNAAGEVVTYEEQDVTYSCIKFCTTLKVDLSCGVA